MSNVQCAILGKDFAQTKDYSEEVAATIDKEVKSVMAKAYKDTLDILKANIKVLEAVALTLIEKEKIEGQEFEKLFLENEGKEFK